MLQAEAMLSKRNMLASLGLHLRQHCQFLGPCAKKINKGLAEMPNNQLSKNAWLGKILSVV
jgi:hypothetical protein